MLKNEKKPFCGLVNSSWPVVQSRRYCIACQAGHCHCIAIHPYYKYAFTGKRNRSLKRGGPFATAVTLSAPESYKVCPSLSGNSLLSVCSNVIGFEYCARSRLVINRRTVGEICEVRTKVSNNGLCTSVFLVANTYIHNNHIYMHTMPIALLIRS